MQQKRKNQHLASLTPAQKEWAYQQWSAGHPVWQIANELFVSEATVYRAFKGRRKRLPKMGPPPNS